MVSAAPVTAHPFSFKDNFGSVNDILLKYIVYCVVDTP